MNSTLMFRTDVQLRTVVVLSLTIHDQALQIKKFKNCS